MRSHLPIHSYTYLLPLDKTLCKPLSFTVIIPKYCNIMVASKYFWVGIILSTIFLVNANFIFFFLETWEIKLFYDFCFVQIAGCSVLF